jgi:hypothetical protein
MRNFLVNEEDEILEGYAAIYGIRIKRFLLGRWC